MAELTAEIPEEFKDDSVNIFSSLGDNSRVSLVVTRADLEADDTLETYSKRTLAQMEKALPNFAVMERQTSEVDRVPTEVVDARFVTKNGPVFQRQALIIWGQRAITITASALLPWADLAKDQLSRILPTIRFRR
jgi:hypothetical protein